MQLTKGANTAVPVNADRLVVSCCWSSRPGLDVDLSALLLSDGRVRSDADFVFYNQPASADEAVTQLGKQADPDNDAEVFDALSVQIRGLDAALDSVVFVASLDGPPGSAFADLPPLVADVRAGDGQFAATFMVDGLSTETAVVVLELYRRAEWWKVRAIGQGYHDGLSGLARDFGVNVSNDPHPEPTAEPVGPPPVDWRHPPVPAGYELG